MKVKFNKVERVAGIFVLVAVVAGMGFTVVVAAKKGWFSPKVEFHTMLETADGIHQGTLVHMSGLRIGTVSEVELLSDNQIIVKFEIFEKFNERVREDSRVLVVRPFIIGEKVIDVTVGSLVSRKLKVGSLVSAEQTVDLMDLLSGRRLGPVLSDLTKMVENFKILAAAFADKKRVQSLINMFDRMDPLLSNLGRMSTEMTKLSYTLTKKQRLDTIVGNLTDLTQEMSVVLPEFKKHVPNMGQQFGQLVANMHVLTEEFKKLTPAIGAIAPHLPRVSLRAVEALDEAVVTLKALQKTFILSGSVEDVLKEEKARTPASEK